MLVQSETEEQFQCIFRRYRYRDTDVKAGYDGKMMEMCENYCLCESDQRLVPMISYNTTRVCKTYSFVGRNTNCSQKDSCVLSVFLCVLTDTVVSDFG